MVIERFIGHIDLKNMEKEKGKENRIVGTVMVPKAFFCKHYNTHKPQLQLPVRETNQSCVRI